jgi:hypothetical protein
MTTLNVQWRETTFYRADIEAPDDYDPALPAHRQSDDVQEELWTILHECGIKTSLDTHDQILAVEVVTDPAS